MINSNVTACTQWAVEVVLQRTITTCPNLRLPSFCYAGGCVYRASAAWRDAATGAVRREIAAKLAKPKLYARFHRGNWLYDPDQPRHGTQSCRLLGQEGKFMMRRPTCRGNRFKRGSATEADYAEAIAKLKQIIAVRIRLAARRWLLRGYAMLLVECCTGSQTLRFDQVHVDEGIPTQPNDKR